MYVHTAYRYCSEHTLCHLLVLLLLFIFSYEVCLKFGKETAPRDFIPSSQYTWYKKVPGRDLPVRRMELTPVSKSLYEPREAMRHERLSSGIIIRRSVHLSPSAVSDRLSLVILLRLIFIFVHTTVCACACACVLPVRLV